MTAESDYPLHEDEATQERDRNRAMLISSAGIAAVGMAIEAAKPEFAPITAALGAAGTTASGRLVDRINDKRKERGTWVLGSGITGAGVSVDDFDRRCQEDPNLLQLCTKVVLAAQDSVFQGKLYGLARSLQSALEDGSKVNEEILFSSVLAQLEAPHIRLLAQIGRNPADTPLNTDNDPADFPAWGYNSIQLVMLDSGLEGALVPLLGILSANGLIIRAEPVPMALGRLLPEHISYSITDFGQHMLARIRGANVDDVNA